MMRWTRWAMAALLGGHALAGAEPSAWGQAPVPPATDPKSEPAPPAAGPNERGASADAAASEAPSLPVSSSVEREAPPAPSVGALPASSASASSAMGAQVASKGERVQAASGPAWPAFVAGLSMAALGGAAAVVGWVYLEKDGAPVCRSGEPAPCDYARDTAPFGNALLAGGAGMAVLGAGVALLAWHAHGSTTVGLSPTGVYAHAAF